MNILLVSQCSGKALLESRRILDQFAERKGERTWQTPITQQGLDTLRQLLRKTARKNTSVACHWIRGHDHSELLWIVGDAKRFNAMGSTPTNSTTQDILRAHDETDWHTAEDIKLLTRMAALWHDFGKSSAAFASKLRAKVPIADAYRHEWVSMQLFRSFVGVMSDEEWLTRLADTNNGEALSAFSTHVRLTTNSESQPLKKLPPLAKAVGWLILTHHRLPSPNDISCFNARLIDHMPDCFQDTWCGSRNEASQKEKDQCWSFPNGLPFTSQAWCQHTRECAKRMLARQGMLGRDWLQDAYVAHVSRMVLMLADHHYSSCPADPTLGDRNFPLYANTDRDGSLKQRLDEHLIGVAKVSRSIVGELLRLPASLPRIARHKGFRRRAGDDRFRWQDKAYDLAQSLRERSQVQGFFGVNMASTGCGKTLANGRIMAALFDPERGTRFSIALGLRTLTLQTGEVYRQHLGLGPDDLAVLVGGAAVRELFERRAEEVESENEQHGSESANVLMPDNSYVHYTSSVEDGPFARWLANSGVTPLLHAPVLVCTIDHLMPACESIRGGHQIAPMLRLMTSDLVLDEPDDFDMDDLPALSRLVFWAGMLGSRVLLSSATLPPALVGGLFDAYRIGRLQYAKQHHSASAVGVCCAWFDEWQCEAGDHDNADIFQTAHAAFVEKRIKKLATDEVRRRASIKPLAVSSTNKTKPEVMVDEIAACLKPMLAEIHRDNHETIADGRRVSIGLLRLANVDPIIDLAQAIYRIGAPVGCRIHLCVYHSRLPLLQRSNLEARLDRMLKRTESHAKQGGHDPLLGQPEILKALAAYPEQDHIWVVLASPVAEVGRDHDYDWAIVEPSSLRSIIQLVGRVRRHRPLSYDAINIYLLETNLRSLRLGLGSKEPAFIRPGFESKDFKLESHNLSQLLEPDQWQHLTAAPRIHPRNPLRPTYNLADLEHARVQELMQGKGKNIALAVPRFWNTGAYLSGALQRVQAFRKGQSDAIYSLVPDDAGRLMFCRYEEKRGCWLRFGHVINWLPNPALADIGISPWGEVDPLDAILSLAEELGESPEVVGYRFGTVALPESIDCWDYHPYFGFRRSR